MGERESGWGEAVKKEKEAGPLKPSSRRITRMIVADKINVKVLKKGGEIIVNVLGDYLLCLYDEKVPEILESIWRCDYLQRDVSAKAIK